MTLEELRKECLKLKGIKKVRKARLGDGIFLSYRPTISPTTDRIYDFTDFIPLDSWVESLKRTKKEYERFFI